METNTVDSQAEDTTQSQADETQTQNEQTDKQEAEAISLDEAKKLRSEAKNLRTRLKDAETRLSAIDSEKLTETQRLQKQMEDATTALGGRDSALKSLILEREVNRLKNDFGLRSTRSIQKLIDTEALEFDLDGVKVSGVDTELKRLKKEDPDLFISGGTDGGAGGGQRGRATEDMDDMIRRQMKR